MIRKDVAGQTEAHVTRAGCAVALIVACVTLGAVIELAVAPFLSVLGFFYPTQRTDLDIADAAPVVLFIVVCVGVFLISLMPEKIDDGESGNDRD